MRSVLELMNTVAEIGCLGLAYWSWAAAILLSCVWGGLKIAGFRSPALRHRVWLFGLAAAMLFPAGGFVAELIPEARPEAEIVHRVRDFPRMIVGPEANPADKTSAEVASLPERPPSFRFTVWSGLFLIWCAGAMLMLIRTAVQAARLWRLCRSSRPIGLEELGCEHIAGECGQVRIRVSDQIGSPALSRVFRPTILLPANLMEWTNVQERVAIIRHELAHAARRDQYAHLFQQAVLVFFYFHPLVRFACHRMRVEREMACDDRVLNGGVEVDAYIESLLKAAERAVRRNAVHTLGVASARRILEQRIEGILCGDRVAANLGLRRKSFASATLIMTLFWMLTPAVTQSAAQSLRQPLGQDDTFSSNAIRASFRLTAAQQKQMEAASKALAEIRQPLIVESAGMSRLEQHEAIERFTKKYPYYSFSGFAPAGDGTLKTRPSGMGGFVKNASPSSLKIRAKIRGFDRPETLVLTEEQRELLSYAFKRPTREILFEPTQDDRDLNYDFSSSPPKRVLENLINTFKPDAYDIDLVPAADGRVGLVITSHYRKVHKFYGHFAPNIYPRDGSLSP